VKEAIFRQCSEWNAVTQETLSCKETSLGIYGSVRSQVKADDGALIPEALVTIKSAGRLEHEKT
jgi:hypothetical protein